MFGFTRRYAATSSSLPQRTSRTVCAGKGMRDSRSGSRMKSCIGDRMASHLCSMTVLSLTSGARKSCDETRNGGARFRSADWFELVSGVSIDLQVPRRYERGKPGCRFQSQHEPAPRDWCCERVISGAQIMGRWSKVRLGRSPKPRQRPSPRTSMLNAAPAEVAFYASSFSAVGISASSARS
jgi:hypothetical protein